MVSFGDWWRNLNEAVSGPIKQGLNSVVILGAWSLWKLRNRCVFDGVSPSLAGLVNQVSEELELWCLAGAKGISHLATRALELGT